MVPAREAAMADVDVLVVGAGPVGLTAACELRRRGVRCRIVDRLSAPQPFAKAVGIQPRTLEIWDLMGVAWQVLEAAAPFRGQLIYVNGVEQARIEMTLPPEVPYRFAALPQYATERILAERLARWETHVERGTELVGFEQDADEVRACLALPSGAQERIRTRFLLGCDGAHSVVRKALGLSFEGGSFPRSTCWGMSRSTGSCRTGTRSGPCTRPTAAPTTCWSVSRCPAATATGCPCSSRPNSPCRHSRRRRTWRTAWKPGPPPDSRTSRRSSTGSHRSPPAPPRSAGPRSSASATAWWTATERAGCSSRETPPISIRPPAPRA
ncbi:hypothetical protein Srufu_002680 [Streptomyces libani subsp. rufus]|nr:hypothetical protein Srufu_002680 [Streptomyces libani subsp. rufus]